MTNSESCHAQAGDADTAEKSTTSIDGEPVVCDQEVTFEAGGSSPNRRRPRKQQRIVASAYSDVKNIAI